MIPAPSEKEGGLAWFEWGPRILIAIAILLLLFFTQRTYRFSGIFDETFLAEDNLSLTRGPLAKPEYYERGDVDYQSEPLFKSDKDTPAPVGPEAEVQPEAAAEAPPAATDDGS